jgi:hypothetical protein
MFNEISVRPGSLRDPCKFDRVALSLMPPLFLREAAESAVCDSPRGLLLKESDIPSSLDECNLERMLSRAFREAKREFA